MVCRSYRSPSPRCGSPQLFVGSSSAANSATLCCVGRPHYRLFRRQSNAQQERCLTLTLLSTTRCCSTHTKRPIENATVQGKLQPQAHPVCVPLPVAPRIVPRIFCSFLCTHIINGCDLLSSHFTYRTCRRWSDLT